MISGQRSAAPPPFCLLSSVFCLLRLKGDPMENQMTKDGLPREAHAIMGNPDHPDTWKLPHHTAAGMSRTRRGRMGAEASVDWDLMPAAVAALSPGGHRGQRVQASAEDIIEAAKHLAAHYRAAGKPVPDTLQALL